MHDISDHALGLAVIPTNELARVSGGAGKKKQLDVYQQWEADQLKSISGIVRRPRQVVKDTFYRVMGAAGGPEFAKNLKRSDVSADVAETAGARALTDYFYKNPQFPLGAALSQ